jgi:hypothetical protein
MAKPPSMNDELLAPLRKQQIIPGGGGGGRSFERPQGRASAKRRKAPCRVESSPGLGSPTPAGWLTYLRGVRVPPLC